MIFGRKYPLCYNIPYDDASCGSPVTVTKIKLSNFEGCPHWYGLMYMPNGDCYELQCKINKAYLDEAHSMRGDWSGYKEGDYTGRFLSKSQIMTAFNLLKKIVK